MEERRVRVQTPDGSMQVFIAHPSEADKYPAVLMYQNVGGLGEPLCDMARRVAREGYYCAVPELYYRLGTIVIDADSDDAQVRAIRKLASNSLDNGKVMQDTRALLAWMGNEPAVRSGAIGTIGYCQGGRFAVLAAEHFPERVKAAASLFGTRLITDEADSPHLLLDRIRGEVYCGFAEHDPAVPPAIAVRIGELLKQCPAKSLSETLAGTEHGFAFHGRKVYHKEAAERTWGIIFRMFKDQIC